MSETPNATARRSRVCSLLLDENLSSLLIADILRKVEDWKIELHLDHLDRGVSDSEVVALCGRHGWALVTCDDMRYTPETRVAMVEHRVRVLKVVRHHDTHGVEIASALIAARHRITSFLYKNRLATCAHVHLSGDLNVVKYFDDVVGVSMTAAQQRTLRKFGKIG